MKISVIVPTHNRADALELTLKELAKQDFKEGWEVIVVNNNCTDNTDAVVAQQVFPVALKLVHEKKPGASAARNAGAKAAAGEYLIFIDNDILTKPDFLQRHYDNLEKYKGCWFVGHAENLPELQKTAFGKFRKSLDGVVSGGLTKIKGITGQNTSMPRSHFVQLNGFDESFHVASGEDLELAMRAQQSGITIYFDPAITVLHNDWAGSSIRDYCRRQRLYSQTDPYFWMKYGEASPRIKVARENSKPSLTKDGFRLYCWKNTKSILGSKAGQWCLIRICEILEKIFPRRFPLWSFYKLAIAGAIYKGFQEGLRLFAKEKVK
ncbi:MAG: glycosyltransferase family 2 protein [Chitinophagaceae bacterium]|nr:glycosyltransferase family 2 protein [Chitinophagaceae bacterium]